MLEAGRERWGRAAASVPGAPAAIEAGRKFFAPAHRVIHQITEFIAQTRIGRTLRRYFGGRGPIFAAGISYTALFSLTAALTVGWTTFSSHLGTHPVLRDSVIEAANQMLPGLFQTPTDPQGLVDPQAVIAETSSSFAGIVAFLVAIYTASTVVFYLARSIRSMFGLGKIVLSWWHNILHRVLGLLTLLTGLMVTAVLITVQTWARDTVDKDVPIIHQQWMLPLFSFGTILVPFTIDALIFMIMVRWVASVRPPRRDFLAGAFISATGATILRLLGTSVITNVSGPLLKAATALITLVVWVNLLAAITLLACAWTANPPRYNPTKAGAYEHAKEVPNYVTMSAPHTLKWADAVPDLTDPLDPNAYLLRTQLRRGNSRRAGRGRIAAGRKKEPAPPTRQTPETPEP